MITWMISTAQQNFNKLILYKYRNRKLFLLRKLNFKILNKRFSITKNYCNMTFIFGSCDAKVTPH